MSSLYVLYDVPELEVIRRRRFPNPGLFRSLLAAVRDWNERRKAMLELYAMPQHMLQDLGINRDQIPEVVNGLNRRNTSIHV